MGLLDPILMVEVASSTAWPEETKFTKIFNILGGSPTHDSDTNTTTITIPYRGAGATGSRPTAPAVGDQYFDTTLGQPVWWNGSAWVGADGT
jgi:hypothetical protein